MSRPRAEQRRPIPPPPWPPQWWQIVEDRQTSIRNLYFNLPVDEVRNGPKSIKILHRKCGGRIGLVHGPYRGYGRMAVVRTEHAYDGHMMEVAIFLDGSARAALPRLLPLFCPQCGNVTVPLANLGSASDRPTAFRVPR